MKTETHIELVRVFEAATRELVAACAAYRGSTMEDEVQKRVALTAAEYAYDTAVRCMHDRK